MDRIIILDSERKNFPVSNRFLAASYKSFEDKYLDIIYNLFIIPKTKSLFKQGNTKIIAADKETEKRLSENSIPFETITRYASVNDYELNQKNALNFFRNLTTKFKNINLDYDGISLWNADESDVCQSFFIPFLSYIRNIEEIIRSEKPKKLVILNFTSTLGTIQKGFNKKIDVLDLTDNLSKFKKAIFSSLMPFAAKNIHSNFLNTIKKATYKPKKSKDVIFFEVERCFCYLKSSLEKIKGNVTILQDEIYSNKYPDFNFDSLNNYIGPESRNKLIDFRKKLRKQLSILKNNLNIKKGLEYNGINLFDLTKPLFDYLFLSGYLRSAYYIECFNNFFKFNKPKLIVVMCEMRKQLKLILAVSKRYQIKSLLVVHASFGKNYFLDSLVSDNIVVYGQHHKDILVSLGNKPTNIVPAGNPYWDHLSEPDFKKEDILSNLKLPKDKKIILFATNNSHFGRDRLSYAVFQAMLNLKDCFLVVKLHPEEKPDFYNKLKEKFKLNAFITSELRLLHPLIFTSDIVIISDSTVGLETILLNKPLIDVNLNKKPYYQDYVKEGVAIGVTKEGELLTKIKSVLNNSSIKENLRKKRQKYIYSHAYKQDGKSGERIANIIKNMIKD